MKYSEYTKYKDSGIEWLGEIPEDWEFKRLKLLTRVRSGEDSKSDEGHYPLYGANGIIGATENPTFCREKVLVGRVGSSGSVNLAKGVYGVSDNCLVLDNQDNVNTSYLHYVCLCLDFTSDINKNAQPLITATNVSGKLVPAPPLPEQRAIAAFLDRETARIDGLIAKKQRQIELLQEKRAALISHAVTKGVWGMMNDECGMMNKDEATHHSSLSTHHSSLSTPHFKDSGIEWLGEIPEHWEVKRLKYTASINDEALSETTDPDYEFTYVDIGSVNAVDGITATEDYRFENAPSRARRIVRDGDTIVSTVRTYLRAITTIRKTDLRNSLIVSTGFAVVRPRSIVSRYLSCILTSSYFVETVVSRSTGVSYPAINASDVGNIEVIVPPLPEQRAIAAFLDRETARIDGLINKVNESIALLSEYRTALISAAVTGKIDVRVDKK